MVQIHPIARLVTTISLLIATFLTAELGSLVLVYVLVLAAVVSTGVLLGHIRFVVFVGLPMLAALLLVWGIAMPQTSYSHAGGLVHAWVSWLRIVACGGILQALFLPLVERPQHLRNFLAATHMNGAPGMLLMTSVVFIPEVKRRLAHIIDARKAQGHDVRGFSGLRQLPGMLMPLVSSLLDSAVKRAELWSHRGVLDRYGMQAADEAYQPFATMLAGFVAAIALGIGFLG